jgi:hypothetical protein
MKKVIDGDIMKCLETFDESQTNQILDKFRLIGQWEEVLLDNDGDVILYKYE